MKTVNFYYVRHGETIFNVTNKAQGSCDSPLTAKGIEQAKQCALKLKDLHIDKAFSSTAERASDTAEIVLQGRDIPLTRLKGLKEMAFGLFEGESTDDLDSPMAKCWKKKDYTSVGGENRQQFEQRIRETYASIVDACEDGDTCLIVSHRGYFYYMLEALFGQNLDEIEAKNPNYLATLIPNASVARFQYKDGEWILLELPK